MGKVRGAEQVLADHTVPAQSCQNHEESKIRKWDREELVEQRGAIVINRKIINASQGTDHHTHKCRSNCMQLIATY